MAKAYTAQEMRDVAQCLHYNSPTKLTVEAAAMLRQAADAMEREEKREKKYEYSVHPADVYGVFQHRSAAELNVNFFKSIGVRAHLVRREVGEWEEVRNDHNHM